MSLYPITSKIFAYFFVLSKFVVYLYSDINKRHEEIPNNTNLKNTNTMYTIAYSPRTDEELIIADLGNDFATLKLQRDKTRLLHEDICQLAEDNQDKLTNLFGYLPLNCYIKLKDNRGWQLICNIKLAYK